MNPDQFTGNVTFCAVRAGQPLYIDPAHLTDEIVVSLSTADCEKPFSGDRWSLGGVGVSIREEQSPPTRAEVEER